MNKRDLWILALVVAIGTFLAALPALGQIKGPPAIQVGQYAVLRSDGSGTWSAPPGIQFDAFEDGAVCVVAGGLCPTTINLIKIDHAADKLEWFTVVVIQGDGPTPDPNPPTPPPEPPPQKVTAILIEESQDRTVEEAKVAVPFVETVRALGHDARLADDDHSWVQWYVREINDQGGELPWMFICDFTVSPKRVVWAGPAPATLEGVKTQIEEVTSD